MAARFVPAEAQGLPFSQGALQEFRHWLIAPNLDRRALERTVELAKTTKAFDPRKLPTTLRVAIDSSPLEGAGRVEYMFNLLAHGARNVVHCAGALLGWTDDQGVPSGWRSLARRVASSALDIDWNDPIDKAEAMKNFSRPLDSLQAWIARQFPAELAKPPLQEFCD